MFLKDSHGLEVMLAQIKCPTAHACPPLAKGPSGIASMAAVRSARRVVATHADRLPLESLMSNLRLNSARLVVERLRVCHLAWGNRGHLTQVGWVHRVHQPHATSLPIHMFFPMALLLLIRPRNNNHTIYVISIYLAKLSTASCATGALASPGAPRLL